MLRVRNSLPWAGKPPAFNRNQILPAASRKSLKTPEFAY
jgi:hypothetical protein